VARDERGTSYFVDRLRVDGQAGTFGSWSGPKGGLELLIYNDLGPYAAVPLGTPCDVL
jgi:hypothetical protein